MALLLCSNSIRVKLDSDFDYVQLVANIGVIVVGIVAVVIAYRQFTKGLEAEKRKEKRQEIQRKLDEFYGPFLQLRLKSNLLYERFSKKYRENDPQFSTLAYLLDGYIFTGNEETLLKEIISIGKECEKLIHSKAGLIDDSKLRVEVIPRATTHYLILKLAFEGALTGDTEEFRNLTFPRELDGLLEKRKKELEVDLQVLNK